jgi:hypothetical protein
MISIRKYHLLRDEKDRCIYHVKSQEASICPICGVSDLIVIGSRKRILYDGSGEKRILVIRRLRCKGCSRVHHELPDQIVPYKRYASESIEEILDQDSPAVACESSSIYRIRRWFLEISEYIAGCISAVAAQRGLVSAGKSRSSILRIKEQVGEDAGWMARAVRILANTNLWVHTRSAFVS